MRDEPCLAEGPTHSRLLAELGIVSTMFIRVRHLVDRLIFLIDGLSEGAARLLADTASAAIRSGWADR